MPQWDTPRGVPKLRTDKSDLSGTGVNLQTQLKKRGLDGSALVKENFPEVAS